MAAISYVLGGRPSANPLEMVGIGVQFLSLDDDTQMGLETWISAANITQRG
jgi:hypothetical protein